MKSFVLLIVAFVSKFLTSKADYKEISPGVFTFSSKSSPLYVSLFVVTDDGVVAIEPCNTKHAEELVDAIRCVTKKPLVYMFISHSHWDHASGGKVFQNAGATVVSHKDAYDFLKYNPGPDTSVPDEFWSGNRKDFVVGNFQIELYHFGKSHGKGMTVFVLPKQEIAYISDLGLPKQAFFLGMPDYNIKGTLNTLKKITELNFKRAILSHQTLGKTGLDGGTKQDTIESFEYIRDIVNGVDDLIAKKVNIFTIPSVLKLEKYKNWLNYEDWYPLNVQRIMLDRHMGPWDPPLPGALFKKHYKNQRKQYTRKTNI